MVLDLRKHNGMKKQPFDDKRIQERIETRVSGKLRIALHLYMEDNETTASEALRDGLRAIGQKYFAEIKAGRRPKNN